jgi:Holliday junction resolvasome RuvABC endonuclease subunit
MNRAQAERFLAKNGAISAPDKAALAKRLGVALPQISRLMDLKHGSRLDVERAFSALGRSSTIVVKAAA